MCAFLCFWAFSNVLAAQYPVLGRLTPDGLVKKTGTSVTVIFTVENQTDKYWTPASVTPQFQYEIFNVVTGTQIRSGKLVYTMEQYVAPNNAIVFGAATISLTGIPAGTYRILLFSSEFRNPANADRLYIGGSTVIRVTL
jgi:hypothetical protein